MIIAAVAIAFVAVAQAASFNWSCTGTRTAGTIYDYSGTGVGSGMVAYLFDTATLTQSELLTAVRGGTDLATLSAVANATTSSSKIAKTDNFDYGAVGSDYTMYFAILDAVNEQLLISATAMAQGQQGDASTFVFGGTSATWSKNAHGDADYSAAGWYSTSVPEPTSGLLLLFGMAGLALKRKHD